MPEPIGADPDDTKLMRTTGRTRSTSSRKTWYAVQNDEPPTRATYLLQRNIPLQKRTLVCRSVRGRGAPRASVSASTTTTAAESTALALKRF